MCRGCYKSRMNISLYYYMYTYFCIITNTEKIWYNSANLCWNCLLKIHKMSYFRSKRQTSISLKNDCGIPAFWLSSYDCTALFFIAGMKKENNTIANFGLWTKIHMKIAGTSRTIICTPFHIQYKILDICPFYFNIYVSASMCTIRDIKSINKNRVWFVKWCSKILVTKIS